MLKFRVTNQMISRTDDFSVVADSRNYLTVKFDFSDEWTGDIVAVFGHGGAYYHQPLENGSCTVPWEVIRAPYFTVSLFCGDLVTANVVSVAVCASGMTDGEVPGTPTPTIFEQYIDKLVEKNQEIADNLESEVSANVSQSVKTYADNKAAAAQGNATAQAEILAQSAQSAAINYANEELARKADVSDVPTKMSEISDDVGYAKKTDIASVYRAKGTIGGLEALTALVPEVGDTYNVTADIVSDTIDTGKAQKGDNIAWNGEQWDNLSGFVDLSGYALKATVAEDISTAKTETSESANQYTDSRAASALSSAKAYTDEKIDEVTIPVMTESEYASAVFTVDKTVIVLPDGTA